MLRLKSNWLFSCLCLLFSGHAFNFSLPIKCWSYLDMHGANLLHNLFLLVVLSERWLTKMSAAHSACIRFHFTFTFGEGEEQKGGVRVVFFFWGGGGVVERRGVVEAGEKLIINLHVKPLPLPFLRKNSLKMCYNFAGVYLDKKASLFLLGLHLFSLIWINVQSVWVLSWFLVIRSKLCFLLKVDHQTSPFLPMLLFTTANCFCFRWVVDPDM